MSASNVVELAIGKHLLMGVAWTKPTALWVALYTKLPAEDGTGGVEVTGKGYARVQHGPSNTHWSAPVNGVSHNFGVVQFADPTANWGKIVGFGLLSAATAGTLYATGSLISSNTASITVNSGDTAPSFAEGALVISLL